MPAARCSRLLAFTVALVLPVLDCGGVQAINDAGAAVNGSCSPATPDADTAQMPDAAVSTVPDAPSCRPGGDGLSNCGSTPENCCTSLLVPGGSFYRMYRNYGNGPINEYLPATVSMFRLDKFDVTVGRFRQFVSAWNAGWTPPAGSGKHTHLNGSMGLSLPMDPLYPANAGRYEPGWLMAHNGNVSLSSANLSSCAALTMSRTPPPPNTPPPPFPMGPVLPYSTWTDSPSSHEKLPINCVNWFEAYAF
jgi:formylglycine-generating enzyme required for sulfatase activity